MGGEGREGKEREKGGRKGREKGREEEGGEGGKVASWLLGGWTPLAQQRRVDISRAASHADTAVELLHQRFDNSFHHL